ncbi:hypothetical protein COBT_000461 [Conglomerata obtusa]
MALSMRQKIKEILVKYLNNTFTKEKLKIVLKENQIPCKKFNKYIIRILNKNTKKYTYRSIYKPERTQSMQTNELLDTDFINSVKAENANKIVDNADSLYKITKEELKLTLFNEPSLNQYFALNKNIVFDINEINFRLMRSCIEYGITFNDGNVGKVVYEGALIYIKNILDDCCVDNKLDENKFKEILFGKIAVLGCINFSK